MHDEKWLSHCVYPGRGMIIGQSPDAAHYVQIYWIMGRSENSRNRIFVRDSSDFVKTEAFDRSKLSDPALIIYFPVKHHQDFHIVTNGEQTDTIHESVIQGKSFAEGLKKWTFEPDAPNYTPRISGILYAGAAHPAYELAIFKTLKNDPKRETRHFFTYGNAIPGIGHCLTTYENDGSPLPAFVGEPGELEVFNTAEENGARYWDMLNEQNRISILVKTIRLSDGHIEIKIINKHK